MNLDERLKQAESNGYISVCVKFERHFFFIENRNISVGDVITDSFNNKFLFEKIIHKNRVCAVRL